MRRAFALVLLLVMAVDAAAQKSMREVLGGKMDFSFDPLNPIIEMPLPEKLQHLLLKNVEKWSDKEKKMLDCFAEVRTSMVIIEVLYGSQPAPGIPDDSAVCRLNAVSAALQIVEPPPQPAIFTVADSVDGVSDGDLRERIAQATVSSSVHAAHLGLLRRQLERTAAMRAGSAALRQKANALITNPAAQWPTAWGVFFAQTPCAAGESAETEAARAALATQWSPFLMYPHVDAILGGVSTSTGHLLPVEVSLCDAGKSLRQCVTAAGSDPWNSACWSTQTESIQDLPCLRQWTSKTARRTMDWTGCTGDFRAILTPYVTMEEDTAAAIAKDPTKVGIWMSLLLQALDGIDPSTDGASARHRLARAARRDELRPLATTIAQLLGVETSRLKTERERLDAETAALAQLRARVQALQAEISILETKKAALATRITTARARQAALDQQAQTHTARTEQLESAIAAATQAAESVQLACGGRSYDDCTDAAAKRDYDRRVYEAHERTSKLLQELFAASDALSTTYNDLFTARQDEILATVDSTTTGFELATKQLDWKDRSDEHQRRNTQLVADENIWKSHSDDHSLDVATQNNVVAELDFAVPQ